MDFLKKFLNKGEFDLQEGETPIESSPLVDPAVEMVQEEELIPEAPVEVSEPLNRQEMLLQRIQEYKKGQEARKEDLNAARAADNEVDLINTANNAFKDMNSGLSGINYGKTNLKSGSLDKELKVQNAVDKDNKDIVKLYQNLYPEKKIMSTTQGVFSVDPLTGQVDNLIKNEGKDSILSDTLKNLQIQKAQRDLENYGKMTEKEKLKFEQTNRNIATREEKNKLTEKSFGLRQDKFGYTKDEKQEDDYAKLIKDYNKDKVVQKADEQLGSANIVDELVSSQNPIASAAIPTYVARLTGEVGALTEADKAPFGGSRALSSKIKQSIQQQAKGTLTEENRVFLADLSQTLRKTAEKNKLERLKSFGSQFNFDGYDKDTVMTRLGGDLYSDYKDKRVIVQLPNGKKGKVPYFESQKLLKKYPKAKIIKD